MAIYEYKLNDQSNEEKLWKVYVNLRSSKNPTLRVQRKQKGFKSKKEAEREELRLSRECERELLEKENKAETWGSLLDKFEQSLLKGDSSLGITSKQDYVAAARKHTLQWSNFVATEIPKGNFRDLFLQLKSEDYSISHLKKVRSVITKIYNFGIDNALLPGLLQAPSLAVDLGREVEKQPEILTITEIRRLLEAAKALEEPWYPIWAVALLTGMRNGELFALLWSDVDFENNTVKVNKSYNIRLKTMKTTKSGYCRFVPISSELRSILLVLKKDAEKTDRNFVLPRDWKWQKGLQARELRNFCKGLGLPSVRFHALRACFATQLIRSGVPPIQIQKICGWKDLKTMQRYIRLAGIEIDGATEMLKVLPASEVLQNLSDTVTRPAAIDYNRATENIGMRSIS
jgi:integrase